MLEALSIQNLIRAELASDRAYDDVTSAALFSGTDWNGRAVIRSKAKGVFCGHVVCAAFEEIFGAQIEVVHLASESTKIGPEDIVVEITGKIPMLLGIERTLVNLLSHACGVATLTRQYVDAVSSFPAKILATRKTLPGLRDLQLLAVQAGGGFVHRRSLSDGILIKDNHLAFIEVADALERAHKARSPLHRVEVEVQDFDTLEKVLSYPPDVIMLDNFSLPDLQRAVKRINGRCAIEVSGGVSLDSVRAIAELGIEYISVGRLTHSAVALDLSMDIAKRD